MTACSLFENLETRGFTLTADGNRLIVRPAGNLTDDDRISIREHKAELIQLLSEPDPVPPKTGRQRVLASLLEGRCPECGGAMDLQSRNYGVVYWCAGCREHFTVSDWLT